MSTAYFYYPQDGGCSYHRVLMPARYCAEHYQAKDWEFEIGAGLPGGKDVYFFHGLPASPEVFLEVLHLSRTSKLVWGVDDDWLCIPDWNPAKPKDVQLALYHALKHVAHHILCSTEALAETFRDQGLGDKVLVAPNLIDLQKFPKAPFDEDREGRTFCTIQPKIPVRVVWSGGPTHSGDIEVLVDPLDKLLSTMGPEKVCVVFNGMSPPSTLLKKHLHRGMFHQPMTPFPQYQTILNSIDAHVYLCPLAMIPFNLSKSNLRVMEAWGLCAAPVATDWGEYNCIKSGHNGRLVESPDSWYSALYRMVTDHEHRVQCAANGRLLVQHSYDWNNEACRAEWYLTLDQILGV